MYEQFLNYLDVSWIDTAGLTMLSGLTNHQELRLSLSSEQEVVQDQLSRMQAELRQLLLPVYENAFSDDPTLWTFNEIPFGSESLIDFIWCRELTTEIVNEWQECCRPGNFRVTRLFETINILKRHLRLLSYAIRLLLKKLSCPYYPHYLIRMERAWSLLHGSHPPRQDAGRCRPAFAKPREGVLRLGLLTF